MPSWKVVVFACVILFTVGLELGLGLSMHEVPFSLSCYQPNPREREWCLSRAEYVEVMRQNYTHLQSDMFTYRGAQYLEAWREKIEEDLSTIFDYFGVTPEEIGFTREEYLRAYKAVVTRNTSI